MTRRKITAAHEVEPEVVQLRVLATTDIHMHLLGHNYVTDQPTGTNGLAGIATLVKQARAEALASGSACVLLDNGDVIQGTIIGDMFASRPVTPAHPLVLCLNALRYDAIGLGNHDLDFGLPYLGQISRQLDMPMVSTNLDLQGDHAIKSTALIHCDQPKPDGTNRLVRVGILSLLPAKTAIWNRHVLEGHASLLPSLPCLQAAIADLKTRGAQVIILLAHLGIGGEGTDTDENALTYAQIPGIDAIVAGHTHRRFPEGDHTDLAQVDLVQVDPDRATIAQRPCVMPGSAASDLAVLDLTLSQDHNGRWSVLNHTGALRSNTTKTKPDADITALCAPAHIAARTYLSHPVGHTPVTLHNYFSLIMPTPIAALTARAKAQVVRNALAATDDANTPLLASVAAHTAGGRGGPDNYVCIARGSVLRRHIAGLSPFANQIWAVRMTGADLLAMLENTARIFQTLLPDQPDQQLISPSVPAFNFDTVFGVEYLIDPTKPPGVRISHLTHQGRPIAPDDPFILATNQFRAAGGGGMPALPCDTIALRSKTSISDALTHALSDPQDQLWPSDTPWSLACCGTTQAILKTSPQALDHLTDVAQLHPEYTGTAPDGFACLRLTLPDLHLAGPHPI